MDGNLQRISNHIFTKLYPVESGDFQTCWQPQIKTGMDRWQVFIHINYIDNRICVRLLPLGEF